MGDDLAIEQAARVSYGKGTRKTSDTRGLIRYLMRHRHTTPFEMVELKFHIALPMDVNRQFVRHRTASINEYSTRYSEAIDARHTTKPGEWRLQSKSNKQGSSGFLESWEDVDNQDVPRGKDKIGFECQTPGEYLSILEREHHKNANILYKRRLEFGVAKEQARKDLPLSTYTILYWKIDLHNLFHFLKLRLDPHAQLEIRLYATAMASIVREIVPIAWEAFEDYVLNAKTFTRLDLELLAHIRNEENGYNQLCNRPLLDSIFKKKSEVGMSDREFTEFDEKLNPTKIEIPKLDLTQAKSPEYFEKLLNE